MWLPGRRAWKGGRQTPALTATLPASHLFGRSLTGAVRATAAITIAITGRSLKRGRQARPLPLLMQLPRGGCSLSAPAPLSQPGVRLAAVFACSPGTATTSGFSTAPATARGFAAARR